MPISDGENTCVSVVGNVRRALGSNFGRNIAYFHFIYIGVIKMEEMQHWHIVVFFTTLTKF